MNNRLQQLADIRNKIYQVTEKLATEIDLHLEATKIDNQAIYALSKISDTYAKLVMTEEKLEQEIAKREALVAEKAAEKLTEETTPPDEEISASDKVILGMLAEKLYGPGTIIPSEANYNYDYYKEKGIIKESWTEKGTPPINRPLSKLASVRGFEGDSEHRTLSSTNKVHGDSSTESTYKSPAEVEFLKEV